MRKRVNHLGRLSETELEVMREIWEMTALGCVDNRFYEKLFG